MADYINNDIALDWTDAIEDDGQEYILLPEGDYDFTVHSLERGTFNGSAKMRACNKAIITLLVQTDKGVASVRFDLIMNKMMEWRISAFFRCIGLKKHGEKLRMDWSKVCDSKGRAHFKPRTYRDNNGNERQINDVVRFYDPEPEKTRNADSAVSSDDDLPFE